MPRPKVVTSLLLAGTVVCLVPGALAGETQAEPARTEAVAFAAWVENGEFIGDEQIRRIYLSAGTNQFGFIIPTGLRVDLSRADRITLTASDMGYFVTMRIISGHPTQGWRQQLLAKYPGATVDDESSTEVAGRHGPLFNLRWKPEGGVDRAVTVAFVPSAAGVLEFALVADQHKASDAQASFAGMLQRLQSGTKGHFRMETFRQPEHN